MSSFSGLLAVTALLLFLLCLFVEVLLQVFCGDYFKSMLQNARKKLTVMAGGCIVMMVITAPFESIPFIPGDMIGSHNSSTSAYHKVKPVTVSRNSVERTEDVYRAEGFIIRSGYLIDEDRFNITRCRMYTKEMIDVCNGNQRLLNGALAALYNAMGSRINEDLPSNYALELLLLFENQIDDKSEFYTPLYEYYSTCYNYYKKYGSTDWHYTNCETAYKELEKSKEETCKYLKLTRIIDAVDVSANVLNYKESGDFSINDWSNGRTNYKIYRVKFTTPTGTYYDYLMSFKKYTKNEKINIYCKDLGAIPHGDCRPSYIFAEMDDPAFIAAYKVAHDKVKEKENEWLEACKSYNEYIARYPKNELAKIKMLKKKVDDKFFKHYLGGSAAVYSKPEYWILKLNATITGEGFNKNK